MTGKRAIENDSGSRLEKPAKHAKTDAFSEALLSLYSKNPQVKKVTLEDLKKVQNAVIQLGESLKTIIELTPDQTSSPDPLIQRLLDHPSIQVAQDLHSIKNLGVLSKVEQLINNDPKGCHSKLVSKDFKNADPQMFFNQGEVSSRQTYQSRVASYHKSVTEITNKSCQVANWPPELPKIHNESLREQVFTHKSISSLHYYLTNMEKMSLNNERLEFLGDAIIHTISAVICYNRFPFMNEGDLSNIRTTLITNNTLSEWAKIYEMDKDLNIHDPQGTMRKDVVGGRGTAAKTPKYIADVFEAYVGGLWVENQSSSEGFDIITSWFEKLASPVLAVIEKTLIGKSPLDFEAKSKLYSKIGSSKFSPIYHTVSESPEGYTVVCKMGNEVIGTGSSRSKKEASLKSAMDALNNTDAILKYSLKREETPKIVALSVDGEIKQELTNYESLEISSANSDKVMGSESNLEVPIINSKTKLGDKIQLQSEFNKTYGSSYGSKPKKFIEALVGERLLSKLKYDTEQDGDTFKSTLKLDDKSLASAEGSTKNSTEKRAAYFALSQNYYKLAKYLKKNYQD